MDRNGFVLCLDNKEYEVSLEKWKIYETLEDDKACARNFIRVIDESGEDYLYPSDLFFKIDLPAHIQESFISDRASYFIK